MLTPEIAQLQELTARCGEAIGQSVRWQNTGGASDGNKFADAGLPNIDTLGPLGGAIHSPEEYVVADSLVTKASHTALILMSAAHSFGPVGGCPAIVSVILRLTQIGPGCRYFDNWSTARVDERKSII